SLALAAAEELTLDPSVVGVVGHSNSSASLSAAQIYNARHLVQIAPTSSAPLLRQVGPYTIRLVPSDVHQARYLAEQVTADQATPRVALFFVNDDYGHALHEEFQALLERAGVPVVYDAPYIHEAPLPEPGATARRIAQEKPDLLIWIGRAAQLRQLLPELRLRVPGIRVLASDGVDEAMTYRNVGGILNGVRYVSLFDANAAGDALDELRSRFHPPDGAPFTAEAAFTYDAVKLLATAARSAGVDREAIREYLAGVGTRNPPYEGVTGTIAFDTGGDPRPAYSLVEVTPEGTRRVGASPSEEPQ
ncbi:MAG: ABC transporter substrate-binding protein, partial [Thermoanaerobaculia bacterium]